MHVKYEKLHVVNSVLLNRIYIARITKDNGETTMISDGRKDVTDEAIKAVISYMDQELEILEERSLSKGSISYTIKDYGKLTWTKFENRE